MLFGFIMWDKLPEQMPIHFGVNGEADGWTSTVNAVVFLPLLLLVIHFVGVFAVRKDKRQNHKAMQITYWLVPILSLYVNALTYSMALGYKIGGKTNIFPAIFVSILMIWIGNYMPKITPNRRLGVKLPWTLADEDNWLATHRFGGKVFVALGVVGLFFIFLPIDWIAFAVCAQLLVSIISVTIYSYMYHRKHSK